MILFLDIRISNWLRLNLSKGLSISFFPSFSSSQVQSEFYYSDVDFNFFGALYPFCTMAFILGWN